MKMTKAVLKHRGTEDTEILFVNSLCALRAAVFPILLSPLLPKLLSGELSVTQATADRGTNG